MIYMEKELRESPFRMEESRKANEETILAAAKEISRRKIGFVVLAGRGSSDNAGNYFKYLCETVTGIPVALAAPSVVTLYGGKLDLSHALTLGISQSGEAEDVLAVLERARDQGGLTLTLTNHPESPMAKIADFHLDLKAGEEKSVAATKTFLLEMYLLARLVLAMSGDPVLESGLSGLPGVLEDTLLLKAEISGHSALLVEAGGCYVLGRGFHNAIAHEIALKFQETAYLQALGYSTSDFHHGPFAMVDGKTPVLLLAPGDETMPGSLEMIEKLRETGTPVLAFTDEPSLPVPDRILLPKVHPYLAPFVTVLAGQMFAFDLSLKRGNDPDRPRNLKKVTVTR